jgi:2,4-dienoyl-CoA reductase-like NADH-dependent reductase (Old Yellow Enzyme family)
MKLTRLPSLKTTDAFLDHVRSLGIDLPFTPHVPTGADSALLRPLEVGGRRIGNRWAIHPMEGWDGTPTGGVTEPMNRRWERFGQSGAKIIWGGEAMAVRPDGRANPNQLILNPENQLGIAALKQTLVHAHQQRTGRSDDLLVGFQLTHSGRFCRPTDKKKLEPRIAYRHPILDKKFGITDDGPVLTDDDVRGLIEAYIRGAKIAQQAGADFVDVKHCHGYLLHEFLSAHTRPGPYGGSFENRTRILREITAGIRAECPGLLIGIRLSAFDFVPYKPDPAGGGEGKLGDGIPEPYDHCLPYTYGFGVDPQNPVAYDLGEPIRFLELLESLDIRLVNLSAGSPYYNPHIQRPAAYPPSDGYQPCEDPLVGVARQMGVVRQLKARFPGLILIGSGYSYLQDYLPHVAEAAVAGGWVDSIGLGRMVLSYPHILHDAAHGQPVQTKLICRTFSDCTTAPRNGLRSGCYPLDDYYKAFEDAPKLKDVKKALAGR